MTTLREPFLILDASLRVRTANAAFYRAFRASEAETAGRFVYDIGNGQWDIPDLRTLLEEAIPREMAVHDFRVEHDFPAIGPRSMLLNARRFPPDGGHPTLVLLAIQDVTDLRRSDAALQDSELRFRRLFLTAKDGILILDAALGTIIEANPFMCGLLGYEVEDFLGKELWEIGLFRDKDANRAAYAKLRETGYIRYEHLPLKTRGGGEVDVEFVSNLYTVGDHQVAQCNIRDITERSRLEREARAQAAVLADLHRRKDEFLAMLSHELRNPLSPILNAVHLLRLQGDENLIQHEARRIIERQVGQLAHIVDDLLEVARFTSGKVRLDPMRLDVRSIVERAVETTRPLIDAKRHSLTVDVPAEPIWLDADPTRLEQVVVNLLNNAAKYTDEGGRMWLRARVSGREMALSVRDSGIGIDLEKFPDIFDMFTQADRSLDRSRGGLGIGLSLVQRLVEMHGGTVEVHSDGPGRGSEFTIRLPLPAGEPQAPAVAPGRPGDRPAHAGRVLVVDDNVDSAETLATLLRMSGHEVKTAYTGPAALAAAGADPPEVILLDIGLPGLNGYEVARRLRQDPRLGGIRLVAMTGYGEESDRRLAEEAGFDRHVVKPVDFRRVNELLAELLAAPGKATEARRSGAWLPAGKHADFHIFSDLSRIDRIRQMNCCTSRPDPSAGTADRPSRRPHQGNSSMNAGNSGISQVGIGSRAGLAPGELALVRDPRGVAGRPRVPRAGIDGDRLAGHGGGDRRAAADGGRGRDDRRVLVPGLERVLLPSPVRAAVDRRRRHVPAVAGRRPRRPDPAGGVLPDRRRDLQDRRGVELSVRGLGLADGQRDHRRGPRRHDLAGVAGLGLLGDRPVRRHQPRLPRVQLDRPRPVAPDPRRPGDGPTRSPGRAPGSDHPVTPSSPARSAPRIGTSGLEGTDVDHDTNRFGLDLFGRLRDTPGNLFFSPYSISAALAMAFAGARKETAEQMARVLHVDRASDGPRPAFAPLDAGGADRGFRLGVANRLWGEAGFRFRTEFLDLTRDRFGAELARVDFAQADRARQRINAWVEQETGGKIRDLIRAGDLGPSTRLVLTDAIDFKGDWSSPFHKAATQDAPFHVAAGEDVRAPMMHRKASLRDFEGDGLKALELPYGKGELAMVVLLPDSVDGLAALEVRASAENLASWLGGLQKREVDAYLPRFTTTSRFNLSELLKAMGMTRAFSPGLADFSGISDEEELFLSAVIHQAFVAVNEEGTEAAAATAGEMRPKLAMMPRPPAVFRADHPFLYLIRDVRSGSILFLGRMANPAA